MKMFSLLFALLVSINQLQARLGETEDQIYKRYGKTFKTGFSEIEQAKVNIYEVNGISVSVTFINGKCARESYSKDDNTGFDNTQVKKLLAVNSLGSNWFYDVITGVEETNNDKGIARRWMLKNGTATARCIDGTLDVRTAEYNHLSSDSKKRQLEKRPNPLSGF